MGKVLEAEGLSAGYVRGKDILNDISFGVEDGDVLVVVGPNGSGKTTLLRAALGLIDISKGSIKVLGSDGPLRGEAAEHSIAYIPQRLELDRTFPLSVREFLRLGTRDADTGTHIQLLELGPLLDKPIGTLSGGQMQRALLAYAVAKSPRLLLMDEPTSWVDTRGADCILCVMEDFKKRGIAMVVVTHDFASLAPVATHVLGLGADGWFHLPALDPRTPGRIRALGGRGHHDMKEGAGCGHA